MHPCMVIIFQINHLDSNSTESANFRQATVVNFSESHISHLLYYQIRPRYLKPRSSYYDIKNFATAVFRGVYPPNNHGAISLFPHSHVLLPLLFATPPPQTIFTAQCTLVHMRGLGIACRPSVRSSVCPSVCP